MGAASESPHPQRKKKSLRGREKEKLLNFPSTVQESRGRKKRGIQEKL